MELADSSSSLKATLVAMGALEKKSRRVKADLDIVRARNATLEAEMQACEQGRTEVTKAHEELMTKHKALKVELSHYQSFLLRISKKGFNEGFL